MSPYDSKPDLGRTDPHQRRRYMEHSREKLDELKARFAHLEIQIEVAIVLADQEMQRQLLRAREKSSVYMATLESRIDRLTYASDDAWEGVRQGLDQAWHDVAEASKRLVFRLAQTDSMSGTYERFL